MVPEADLPQHVGSVQELGRCLQRSRLIYTFIPSKVTMIFLISPNNLFWFKPTGAVDTGSRSSSLVVRTEMSVMSNNQHSFQDGRKSEYSGRPE